MRIECEVCSATYTIDDAQLGDQPIGAQCPYCGHVRLVRRGDQGGGRPQQQFGPAQTLGFGAAPPAAPQQNGYGGYGPATGMQPSAQMRGGGIPSMNTLPFGSPAVQAGAGGMPFGVASPFGAQPGAPPFGAPPQGPPFGAPPPQGAPFGAPQGPPAYAQNGAAAPASRGTGRSGAAEIDFSAQAPAPPMGGGGGGGAAADRFAQLDGFEANDSQGGAEGEQARCQVCGTALTDEFDKVIGLCDVHQRDRRGQDGGPGGGGMAASDGANVKWHVRTRDGQTVGPLSLEDLRAKIRAGEYGVGDEFSKDGGIGYSPLSKFQEIAYLGVIGNTADAAGGGLGRPRSSFAKRGASGPGRLVKLAIVAVVLGGAGFGVYANLDDVTAFFSSIMPGGAAAPFNSNPNPLLIQINEWKKGRTDVSGAEREQLVAARAHHLEDTWKGYQLAEEAFQKALILEPSDPVAVAGYVENLAMWRFPLASAEEIRAADAAIKWALDLKPDNPAVNRGSAALALARKDFNACRNGADLALEKDATDGLAKLILAGCYMEGNTQLSVSEAEKAAKLVPELRRADRVLAYAYAKVGRYGSALRLLDARLKSDPKNGEVHILYGDLTRDLGKLDVAEQHYKAAIDSGGDVQEAHLAYAEFLLEGNNLPLAITEFKKAADVRGAQQPERLARAYAGLARAELLRDRPKDALKQAKLALNLMPREPEVLLVNGEAQLSVGSATTAAAFAKRALDIRAGEPALLVLAGRAAARNKDRDLVVKYFEEAMTNAPSDARIKGIFAAAYLTLGSSQQAYTLMRKAADIDPSERLSRSRTGPLAITDIPVREAVEAFRRSATEEGNASVANSAIGLLYYQVGDKQRAVDAIARALKSDDKNATALLYQAQLALDHNDYKQAEVAATHILSVDRGAALGYLMMARAHARQNNIPAAVEQYGNALRSNPGLLVAKVEIACIEFAQGQRDRAIQELATAYQVNPQNRITRTCLYQADY